MNIVPAALLALSLCASSSLAQVYPPPIVFTRTGPTFTSGPDTLTLEFADIVTVDDFGNAFIRGAVRRNGSTSYVNAVLQSDGTTVQLVGDRATFGQAVVPPTTQLANFDYRGASASGTCFTLVSANSENSLVVKQFDQPRRAITDETDPAPGVLGGYLSYLGFAPSNYVMVEKNASSELWVGDIRLDPVPFTRVFELNTQAPGMPAGVTFSAAPRMLTLNSLATYAFSSGLAGPGITFNTNDRVIAVGSGTSSSIVARTGTPAPGISDGTITALAGGAQYDYIFLSETGEIAFNVFINSPTRGGRAIYFGEPGSIALIAACGTSAIPGLPGRVNDIRFDMSPNGHRVIWAGVNSNGSASGYNGSALITGSTDAPSLIARTGQTAPGLPAGTTLGQIKDFVVNDLGWIAFRADFSVSPTYPTGGTALFGWSGGPGINLVFAPGQVLDLGSGVSKTLSNNTNSVWLDMNAAGLAALPVGFTDGSGGVIGRNIFRVPPPVGFALGTPQANSQSIPLTPTLTWVASSNADSYTVSITPEGGSTSTYSTTGNSFEVPLGILLGCQNITWGVVAVNPTGTTASTPTAQVFTTFAIGCLTPPVYSIQNIGLGDPVYQAIAVTQITAEGRIAGTNDRYGSSNIGKDCWMWDGQMSPPLGLFGFGYEGDTSLGYARRTSSISFITPQGLAVGMSTRYISTLVNGSDCWVYNGSATTFIGLTGNFYDRTPGSTNTRRDNYLSAVNTSGVVVGGATRWSPTGSGTVLGGDAWRYDGTSTQVIGLFGPGYDFSNGSETQHDVSAVAINASGTILGRSQRWFNTSPTAASSLGQETWLQDGATISTVRITGPGFEFQSANGLQRSASGEFLNDIGQVAGTAVRRNATGVAIGNAAFRWQAGSFQIIDPADSVHSHPTTTARTPAVKKLSPGGYVVGEAARFHTNGNSTGIDVWFYDGTQTRVLGLTGPQYQDNPTAPDATATRISQFISMNPAGQVLGLTESWANGPSNRPLHAWVFDPATGLTTTLGNAAGVVPVQRQMTIDEHGAVIGNASAPVAVGSSDMSFVWSAQTGMRPLASRVLGGLLPQGWQALHLPLGGVGQATHGWPSLITGAGSYPTSLSRRGFVLTYVPAPGGFPLLSPPDGASVDSPMTTHTWEPSTGATSYTVAFTPDGGTPTIVQTTDTTLTLPSSLAVGCERITWTVIANAPTGSTTSTPPTRTFTYLAADYNRNGAINVQDIFDFLSGWFSGDPHADFNGANGIGVQDIFDFLAAWFAGCA